MPSLSSLLGTGMLQQGATALLSRPYQLHVQEAKAAGETPMTAEEFEASLKNKSKVQP